MCLRTTPRQRNGFGNLLNGDYPTQSWLGVSYATGHGVPKDVIRAHMWLNLAAAQGNEEAIAGRDLIAKQMTTAQIDEAQKLAREWKRTP
jgi:uncharacterized protein